MNHQEVEKFIGQTMESDFREIRKAWDLLRQLVEQSRGEHDDTLMTDLSIIGDFLTSRARNHLRLEKRIGACCTVSHERPRLKGDLRKVEADYQPLADAIEQIKAGLDGARLDTPKSFDELEARLDNFNSMLLDHAEKGNLFVLDAFNQEIGQSD